MPLLDGVAATQRLREEVPICRVILLTSFDDEHDIVAGFQAGAQGYVLKTSSSELLVETIHAVVRGETILHPRVATTVVHALRQSAPVLMDFQGTRDSRYANGKSSAWSRYEQPVGQIMAPPTEW